MTGRRRPGEAGSLAVELSMIVPSILLLFGLVFAYGRAAQVNGMLESGTRDAARTATVARSYDSAQRRARAVVEDAAAATPQSCRDTLSVSVSDNFRPGEPITVTATCTYSISDIGLPGAPGSIRPHSSFTSMLDPNRGVR